MYTIESHHHHITPRTRTLKEPHYQYRTTEFGITTPHHWFHHTTPFHTDFDITTHTDIESTILPIPNYGLRNHHTTPHHTEFDITTTPYGLRNHHTATHRKTSHTTISHHSHGHQNKYTTTIEIRTSESP